MLSCIQKYIYTQLLLFTNVNLQLYTFVFHLYQMTTEHLAELHKIYREKSLFGRYISNNKIQTALEKVSQFFSVKTIGHSEEKRPIVSIDLGQGTTKVLLWSQMHGNESTTTKAIFDFLNVCSETNEFENLLRSYSIKFLPIINPDGAQKYTRINANEIDLNRDAQDLSQNESRVLRQVFDEFQPDFCFNLHGQRTIFGVGDSGVSSTLSFLAPAQDHERKVSVNRKRAMEVIANLNEQLQRDIPYGIGRYNDDFNINCVGDTLASLGIPTILYEAGHYPGDYDREVTRELIFKALYYGLYSISGENDSTFEDYFKIPDIKKNLFDIILRNVRISEENQKTEDVAIQFKEELKNDKVVFVPIVSKIGDLNGYFGHREIEGNGQAITDGMNQHIKVNNEIDCVMLNSAKYLIKS